MQETRVGQQRQDVRPVRILEKTPGHSTETLTKITTARTVKGAPVAPPRPGTSHQATPVNQGNTEQGRQGKQLGRYTQRSEVRSARSETGKPGTRPPEVGPWAPVACRPNRHNLPGSPNYCCLHGKHLIKIVTYIDLFVRRVRKFIRRVIITREPTTERAQIAHAPALPAESSQVDGPSGPNLSDHSGRFSGNTGPHLRKHGKFPECGKPDPRQRPASMSDMHQTPEEPWAPRNTQPQMSQSPRTPRTNKRPAAGQQRATPQTHPRTDRIAWTTARTHRNPARRKQHQ